MANFDYLSKEELFKIAKDVNLRHHIKMTLLD